MAVLNLSGRLLNAFRTPQQIEELNLKFIQSCLDNDLIQVRDFIKSGADVNYMDDRGTPLTISIKWNRKDIIAELLNHPRIQLNLADKGGQTPLIYVAKSRDGGIDILNTLRSHPMNLNARDLAGNTALMYAVMVNNLKLVKELVSIGTDVNISNNTGHSPLHQAIIGNNPDMVWFLISKGSVLNVRLTDTLLKKINPEIIKLLKHKKTSISHPYTITKIAKRQFEQLHKGIMGVAMCPGRASKNWDRNMEEDFKVINRQSVDLIISVITLNELTEMHLDSFLERLSQSASERGISHIHFSCPGKFPKIDDNFLKVCQTIITYLQRGKIVLIHSLAGKYRAILIASVSLILLGIIFGVLTCYDYIY